MFKTILYLHKYGEILSRIWHPILRVFSFIHLSLIIFKMLVLHRDLFILEIFKKLLKYGDTWPSDILSRKKKLEAYQNFVNFICPA